MENSNRQFAVKMWFVSGAYEHAAGDESLCRTVFEEALSDMRVVAAELHDHTGAAIEAFGRTA
jgi:hypothetical protein